MIQLAIPGVGEIVIENIVLDYNGTLAIDGIFITAITDLIFELSNHVNLYVITADTFGTVTEQLKELPVQIIKMETADERTEKMILVRQLGRDVTVSIGNGSNDQWMLKESRIGICIIGHEGCAVGTLQAADLVIQDIRSALELFIFPNRLKATLRY